MQKLVFLNTREKEKIMNKLRQTYGFKGDISQAMLMSSKQKIYLLSRDISKLEKRQDKELRIDSAGLYIARVEPDSIRLSIEGSQLIGPHATKHVLEIDENHLESWVKGEDFLLSENEKKQISGEEGFFIIKHGKDYMGCASIKNNKARPLISKERRIKNLNQ